MKHPEDAGFLEKRMGLGSSYLDLTMARTHRRLIGSLYEAGPHQASITSLVILKCYCDSECQPHILATLTLRGPWRQ